MTGRIEVAALSAKLGYVLAPRIGSSADIVSDGDRSPCLVVLKGTTGRELAPILPSSSPGSVMSGLTLPTFASTAGATGWSRRRDGTAREPLVALVLRHLLAER